MIVVRTLCELYAAIHIGYAADMIVAEKGIELTSCFDSSWHTTVQYEREQKILDEVLARTGYPFANAGSGSSSRP